MKLALYLFVLLAVGFVTEAMIIKPTAFIIVTGVGVFLQCCLFIYVTRFLN